MARKPKRDLTVEEQLARGPIDLPFLMLVLLLLGIGLIMMFSASYATAYYHNGNPMVYISRQAVFGGFGVAMMYVISKINYQTFRTLSFFGLAVSIVMLVLVYTPLGVVHNNARRWLKLGIEFQPSEFAKIAVIVFFAARLSKRNTEKHKRYKNRTWFGRMYNRMDRIGLIELIPYGVILGTVALLVVFQPHMSGTLLILAGGASVLFAAGIHWGWFLAGGSIVGLSNGTVPDCHRVRRFVGTGAGQQHAKDALYSRIGERFCFPDCCGRIGVYRGAVGACAVLSADSAGVLAGAPREG